MFSIAALDDGYLDVPSPQLALEHPNGLLAVGGDLSPVRLVEAYRQGIFPWFGDDEPIMWWSPNPRALITPESLHISKSMRRFMKNTPYTTTWNRDFRGVIESCAAPRTESPGTWITDDMKSAYIQLYDLGIAHSIEVWNSKDQLVAGLYGISLGSFFFGESMFSREPNTSKLALITLIQDLSPHGLSFLDCQMMTKHLKSLGAFECNRDHFLQYLSQLTMTTTDLEVSNDLLQQEAIVRHSVLNIYLEEQKNKHVQGKPCT